MYHNTKASGARICELRLAKKLDQIELAELLNISHGYISFIESRKRGCSVDLMIQISEIFGTSLDYLILDKCHDVLDAGEYIEKIFPFLGVRFIAVNDNYDSFGGKNTSDELIIPFKNLINEAYCRDISVKVHTQLEVKRKSGQYIGAFAVYGYLKDETDKNHLVVDEYAADIVRDIFSWKLEGVSPQDIASRLNRSGVLSPMEYKKSLGMEFATSFKANPQAVWSANAVLRVLKNPVYTGVLIQGRETTPSYKVRKRVTKPESEWAIAPDAHEAIIERRDFDSVQKTLSLDTRRSPGDSAVQLFSGMVFCGECGASMVRKTVPSGKKKYVYYVCAAHKQDRSCSPHRMRDEALEQLVLDTVNALRNVCAGMLQIAQLVLPFQQRDRHVMQNVLRLIHVLYHHDCG